MPVLFRIAFRNLMQHKGKTFIIGTIIAVGVVVLIVGNAFMDTAAEGIERAFIDNYTGHAIVTGVAEGPISLFGVQTVGQIEETPVIPEYPRLREYLEGNEQVSLLTSQITGFGLLRPEDERVGELERSTFSLLFGIDPSSYRKLFDNLEVIEGEYLQPGQRGVMISRSRIERMERQLQEAYDEAGIEETADIVAGDEIRLVGRFTQGIPRIRVVRLAAVYEPTKQAEGVGVDLVSYADAQTLRALFGLNTGGAGEVNLTEFETALLDDEGVGADLDLDTFFGGAGFGVDEAGDGELSVDELDNLLGSSPPAAAEADEVPSGGPADGADRSSGESVDEAVVPPPATEVELGSTWQYFIVKLENPRRIDAFVREANDWFEEQGIPALAANWEAAAGPFATTADVIRTVFNIAVIVIGVVAVIIMMNTLVISVVERTAEIGTMRALGAQKGFVWRMFLYETLTVSAVFGAIGVILALVITAILNAIGIPATNTFLEILFAGPELHPEASLRAVITSVLIIAGVGFAGHLYPVTIALKIQPVRAMQSE